jgi:hypothetical protein
MISSSTSLRLARRAFAQHLCPIFLCGLSLGYGVALVFVSAIKELEAVYLS